MMPLAEIAAHTVHLEECRGLVATSLGLKMEVGFICGSKEVKETWSLLDHLDCHIAPLLLVSGCKGLQRQYFVWVSPVIVHQHSPASLMGNTEGLTSLTHRAFLTLLERLSDTFDQHGCPLLGTS